jgi:hypothetical protein
MRVAGAPQIVSQRVVGNTRGTASEKREESPYMTDGRMTRRTPAVILDSRDIYTLLFVCLDRAITQLVRPARRSTS